MAARRLLIVMLVLLGLSTLAAALIPPQALREGTTDTASTTEEAVTAPPETPTRGKHLAAKVTVKKGKRPVVPIKVGDQLSLVVRLAPGLRPDQLEMPAFGLVDAVGPDEPARFEILAQSAGSYKIRFVSNKRTAARIEVQKRGTHKRDKGKSAEKQSSKRKPGKKSAKSRAPAEPDRS
jgi:hypothetical protein